MDAFARGLLIADKLRQNGKMSDFRKARYASFDSGKGKDFAAGKLDVEHPLATGPTRFLQHIVLATHDGTLLVVNQP